MTLLALITGTLAKVGNEIYNLQRPEIDEVAEAATEGVVGSITMPQKQNPERSEHLVTLARLVRSSADLALEGLVAEHERDGAAWKTEWELLPRACGAAAVSLRLGTELLDGLQVNAERMRANVAAQDGYVLAEPVMLALGELVGPRRAHELVHAAAARGRAEGLSFRDALAADPEIPDVGPRRTAAGGERARRGSRPRGPGAAMTDPPEGYLGAGARITRGPAPELVEAGYELELADAPLLGARARAGRPRARARARRDPGRRPPRAPRGAGRAAERGDRDRLPLRRPRQRARAGTRAADRQRRGMAQRGPDAARGRAHRVPDRATRAGARPRGRRRALRRRAGRGGGARARHADAGLHVPAGRAADDRRPLAALIRLPGAARRRAAARRPRMGGTAARPGPAA